MKDYLIIGCGLAGISFAETALKHNKTFTVFTDTSQNSSIVAAGIYNPVIVKRLSMPSGAAAHMDYIKPFYAEIEQRLKVTFDHKIPLYRKFASVEEQNDWFAATDKPGLSAFLSTKIILKHYDYLPSPFGFGEVLHTGYADTALLVDNYKAFLKKNNLLIHESFDYNSLEIHDSYILYKGIMAKNIVFAEGFGIHANPFFSNLPLAGTKGELLLVRAPLLKLDAIVNAGVFILPVGNDLYKVGATYEWTDKTSVPTAAAKAELLQKLNGLITCDYEVMAHYAGIRPTTKDRKALIGTHPKHKRVHLLNGLGTRGVMLGPPMAKQLFDFIEHGIEPDPSVNLSRFMV
ncbi:FAD-dependent oxidoreductase [Flavobacterium cyanobacteriorum]|uniref:FAD-dependent oxidoreductase n=1 Tax=Flavobacterium cyanobacteriorum TaxID=2022802 RepID=A0A255Z644_9FLAO|nr:FAD-binding oxidoreductase [Flavobacterium cyanobacteriorum]OYQ36891.1 FAD-dependent oxidoreductase [Flavobacterium cyanobacteriorum]